MDFIRNFSTLTQNHPIWTLSIFTLLVFIRFFYIKNQQQKASKDWWRKIDLDSYTSMFLLVIICLFICLYLTVNPVTAFLEKLPLNVKRFVAYFLFFPTLMFNLVCSYFFPSNVYSWYNRIDDSCMHLFFLFYLLETARNWTT